MTDSDAARARAQRKATKRGKQRRRQAWRDAMLGNPDRAALGEALDGWRTRHSGPRAAPIDDQSKAKRWVPIGPSIVALGQAIDRPRVTGRINDLAVEPTEGRRAYAASGNGGVWYTPDAGATWVPVGPWAERTRDLGGRTSAMTGGCLLVEFGATAKDDVVLVGTGEFQSTGNPISQNPDSPSQGGVGILSAIGPVDLASPRLDPWDPDKDSLTWLEGQSVNRLVRKPGATAGAAGGATPDLVVACTSIGLFRGTRVVVPASGGQPEHSTYHWENAAMQWPATRAKWVPASAPHPPRRWPTEPNVTDAVWLPSGRLVLAVDGFGVVLSDDVGENLYQVPTMDRSTLAIGGRISLAAVEGKRVYVLFTNRGTGPGSVRVIADATLDVTKPTAVAATALSKVPTLFGSGQGDYDQCIVVDRAPVPAAEDLDGTNDGRVDRLYLGGDTLLPAGGNDYCASLWIMDVKAGLQLVAAPRISRTGGAPNGAGATNAGLVGNNVHPDVHVIRLAGPEANRTVWVGCDGGVFVSTQGGRTHTFAPRVNGLATLEPGFLATHPTTPQYLAAGAQDNGVLVRVGDTVWEEQFEGDGGGVAFHPTVPDVMIGQWTQGVWQSAHPSFRDPLQRQRLNPNFTTIKTDREHRASSFYCGAAVVAQTTGATTIGRMAIGTNRVWLTDDLGGSRGCTWKVLPFVTTAAGAAAADPRGAASAGMRSPASFGVPSIRRPATTFTTIRTLKWVSDTEILAVYPEGICRWTDLGGRWTAKLWPLSNDPGGIETIQTISDVAPIPGTHDFYATTVGVYGTDFETVWLYSSTGDTFTKTKLREQLDTPGHTPGPLDPAYCAVVDPGHDGSTPLVYVGTATGVWVGVKQADGTHKWDRFDNGLPQATVQDLSLWTDKPLTDAGARSVRILRAAVQSRGVWEVDLESPAVRHTFVRVHQYDDRRTLPVNLANPRRILPTGRPTRPTQAALMSTDSSPDITVRPRWPLASAPRWIGPNPITARRVPSAYELWLFQTAFRWLYPSVIPTGTWTQAFGDLVALERTKRPNVAPAATSMRPPGPLIDQQLWDAVMGTRLAADLSVSSNAADRLAVASPPWVTPLTPNQVATEIDLMESVVPPSATGGVWTVYAEPSSVDVLLHHRDSRPVSEGRAWAVLLWQYVASAAAGLTASVADVTDFHDKVWKGQPSSTDPPGWTVVRRPDGSARHPLDAVIDARMPRAVTFDVDLTRPTAPLGQPQPPAPAAVVFLALVGSLDDDPAMAAPSAPTAGNVNELVTRWPHAAARVCLLQPRP